MRVHSKAAIIPLLVVVLAALACNFPSNPSGPSSNSVRQTMEAAGGTIPPGLTPPPGSLTPSSTTPIAAPATSGPAGRGSYVTRPGDTLGALSARFGVPAEQITASQPLSGSGYLPPGTALSIPEVLGNVTPETLLLPDSEAIDSPSAAGFDVTDFVRQSGGFLSTYQETVGGESVSGAEIIERVSREASVNPRLLLALLEFRAGWVYGQPRSSSSQVYPLGFAVPGHPGLYEEMAIAGTHLNIGYYGWRLGTLTDIRYSNGTTARLNPRLNPGTAGLQNLMAKFYKPGDWQEALYGQENFLGLYHQMFGDPQVRAAAVEPILPPGLAQPTLELPFRAGERWSFTGGPHFSWNTGSPNGALDFSPVTGEATCAVSKAWATAAAPGVIARADHNVVALDLDGDGNEQTGWVLVYVHLAEQDMVQAGQKVELDQPLGHPSCERGQSTGKHVHIARKYNGEWLPAVDPMPFILSGWLVEVGGRNYQGLLVKGDLVVSANPGGPSTSLIIR